MLAKVSLALSVVIGCFAGAAPALAQGKAQSQRSTTLPVATAVGESGVLNSAPYRIDVPAGWRGGLIVLFHGYVISGEKRSEPYPALTGTALFLARGYAVIQSGYSRQGWAVAEARADTRALRDVFERRFGRPGRTYAVGYSMGGHLALATVEQEAARYDGALSLCGANMPTTSLLNKAVADLAAAQSLFPNTIPDLNAADAPALMDGQPLQKAIAGNLAAAAQLATFTGFRAANLHETLWLFYAVVRELNARAGGFPGDNRQTLYRGFGDDRAFNDRVKRYAGSRVAAGYIRAHSTLTGRLRDPVVLLSNAYDDVVSVSTQHVYPGLVRRAGRSDRLTLLPSVGEGHCRFNAEQIGAAFDRLRRQAEGPLPTR